MTQPIEIEIKEEFSDPQGRLLDLGVAATQQHVDIRSFDGDQITSQIEMLHLDVQTMLRLDGLLMSDIEGQFFIEEGELWGGNATVTVGRIADHNNHRGIVVNLTTGINIVYSNASS